MRIAHEIVEKTGGEGIAVVGIHRRGAVLAARVRDLVAELVGEPVPLGDVDISFYRDDLRLRAPDSQPVVHASHIGLPRRRRPRSSWWTTCSTRAARCGPRSTRSSTTGAARRVQLAVLADRGHRELPIRPDYVGKNLPTARSERVNVRVEEIDGADEVAIVTADLEGSDHVRRHLLSVDDVSRDDIERILGRAESFAEVSGREIKKVPTLRGRTVINLFYEASTRTSSSFELAAKRLSADLVSVKSSGLLGGQGRVAEGHGADALGLRPGGDRDPLAARGRRRPGGALDPRLGGQRRRRQARAPHAGAARRLHAAAPPRRRWTGCACGSWATCSTAGSPAPASWPSPGWAARSRSAARPR